MTGREAFLDRVAHFLYCPTMLGRAARARWHHRIHLIPRRLLARACDRYDRWLGVTETEMTRTAARPVGWRCQHYSITFGGLAMGTPPTYSLCNCKMQPIYGGSR